MTPDDPRHGTRAGYIAGCRNDCCRDVHLRYQKQSKLRYHREGTQVVDAAPVVNRLRWWYRRGISRNALCRAADLGEGTLLDVWEGRRSVIYKSNRDKVLAVTWDDLPDNSLAYAELTRVRIGSLMAAGHTLGWIAGNVRDLSVGGKWREQERVTIRLAKDVRDLYATAPLDGPSKGTATKARKRYPHPLAWDDDGDLAKPLTWQPHGEVTQLDTGVDQAVVDRLLAGVTVPSTPAEKRAALAKWIAAGNTEASLCRLHGWRHGRYSTHQEAS